MKDTRGSRLRAAIVATMLAAGLAPAAAHAVPSNTPVGSFPVADGTVTDVVVDGSDLLVAGSFGQLGPSTGSSVPTGPATGALAASFPKVEGTVADVEPDGAGGWYLVGQFSSVGGQPHNDIAHVEVGTGGALQVDADFKADNTLGELTEVERLGDRVYVAGASVNHVNGIPRGHLYAVDATSGALTSWAPSLTSSSGVTDLEVSTVGGTRVWVSGSFTAVNSTPRARLAALDPQTGALGPSGPEPVGEVRALDAAGDRLYLAGGFTALGATARDRLAALDLAQASPGLTSFAPTPTVSPQAVAATATRVYVGGTSGGGLQAFTTDGAAVGGFGPAVAGPVLELLVSGGRLYLAGEFDTVGGQPRTGVAAVDPATGALQPYDPVPGDFGETNSVRAMAPAGDRIVLGGEVQSYGGVRRPGLARVAAGSGLVAGWTPTGAPRFITHATRIGNRVYVDAEGGVTAFDATTGAKDTAFAGTLSDVQDVDRTADGKLVVAQLRTVSLRDPATGAQLAAVTLPTDVQVVRVIGDRLYVGRAGAVQAYAAESLAPLGGFTAVTLTGTPVSLEQAGAELVIGGLFGQVNGQARQNVAIVDGATGVLRTSFAPPTASGPAAAIAVNGTTVSSDPASGLRGWSTATGSPTSFAPDAGAGYGALAVAPQQRLVVGGQARAVAGLPSRPSLIAFDPQAGPAVPENTVPPVVEKPALPGQGVTCSPGTWRNGVSAGSFVYAWLRNGTAIVGATTANYTITAADLGQELRCRVSGANAAGTGTAAVSAPVIAQSAPINTGAPTLSPAAGGVGTTFTCSQGTWSGGPTQFRFAWKRGEDYLAGQSGSTYVAVQADVGKPLTCEVTGSNAFGSDSALSTSATVIDGVPVNTELPAVGGQAVLDATVTCADGQWTNAPASYTYVWLRDGQPITGATAKTYKITQADVGHELRCRVVAKNAAGDSAPATSAPVVPTAPLTVSVEGASVTETDAPGVVANVKVKLNRKSPTSVSVRLRTQDATATAPADYAAGEEVVTFSGDEVEKTVAIAIAGDDVAEQQEAFKAVLDQPSTGLTVAQASADVVITDDDAPAQPLTISASSPGVTEGDTGTVPLPFVVSLSRAAAAPLTLTYAVTPGTASTPEDFVSQSGTLTIEPGITTATLPVTVKGDTLDESDETVRLSLSAPSQGTITTPSVLGTIRDDDDPAPAPPVVSIDDVRVDEGAGTATFTLTLSKAPATPATVAFATSDGSAHQPGDYGLVNGAVTFPAGTTTRTVAVPVKQDTIDEPEETFTVALSAVTAVAVGDGLGVGTIVDDDEPTTQPGPPRISVDDLTVAEGDAPQTANATFALRLSRAVSGPVRVRYATQDREAAAPGDYAAIDGTVTFPAGTTLVTVTARVQGDDGDEPDERFALVLSQPEGADLADGEGLATIVDDDDVACPCLSVGDTRIVEGTGADRRAAVVPITLSPTATPGTPVSVRITSAPGTAAQGDFGAIDEVVTFTSAQDLRLVPIQITPDADVEGDEQLTVTLSAASGAAILDGSATVTVQDDDRDAGELLPPGSNPVATPTTGTPVTPAAGLGGAAPVGGSGTPALQALKASITLPTGKARTLLAKGASVRTTCDRACEVQVRITVSDALRKAMGLRSRVLTTRSATLRAGKAGTVRTTFSSALRRKLGARRSGSMVLEVAVSDLATGEVVVKRRTVSLRP
ncbi:Calx-beta domain-containing protein [Conexibacter sp. SYSU D00693]|uniref:Calx-beta domain-containing protein n=1 Tax=Conexibacter sp. SYSU D00693 TaxID=2812560 RepID=UPI00196B51EA|nr:Calx-beta domain-containing protein [Conexibacter sp. SYSU D00693]